MNKRLYCKLALNNIKKDKNTFFPFLISVIAMVALFYMLLAVQIGSKNSDFYGASDVAMILETGVVIVAILSVGIIFYTNSFLTKRRSKELGLYNILGMEKKHIAKVVFWEIAFIAAAGIISGIIIGIVFSKLMFLIMLNMINVKIVSFGISAEAVKKTVILFVAVFVADIIYNRIRVAVLKPVDMLGSGKKGEKEPKAKWFMAILGVICIGIGYYLANTINNPIEALSVFFVAVLFVIAGTYFAFTGLSIVLLKMLKNNKKYYYHKTHFITVSDMMYRMKKNAAGLTNICIFSTAVLVVLSTTVSLYIGIDDEVKARYPYDVECTFDLNKDDCKNISDVERNIDEYIEKVMSKYDGIKIKEADKKYASDIFGSCKNGVINTSPNNSASDLTQVSVMIDDYYNNKYGKDYEVEKGKYIIGVSDNADIDKNAKSIKVDSNKINAEKRDDSIIADDIIDEIYPQNIPCILILCSDFDDLYKLNYLLKQNVKNDSIIYYYSFNISGSNHNMEMFCKDISNNLHKQKFTEGCYVSDAISGRKNAVNLYGGLLFIGIFIGIIFLIATVLIIYYKQISEGYEDRENFVILQKVGLDSYEVKKIINNQMKMVFFFPIIAAVIHIIAAYNIIKELLIMLNLQNTTLFVECTIGTILVFVLFYLIVYKLTSRVYYRIVHK